MAFLFEKLKVCQRSVDFAESIMTITGEFPRGYYYLTDQLNRASTSIAANIAEGNGRFTKSDRKNLMSKEQFGLMKNELEEISRMLTGLIKGTDNREI